MTSAAAPAPTASPWFRSPSFDFLLILGVPFLTWPIVYAANGEWGAFESPEQREHGLPGLQSSQSRQSHSALQKSLHLTT